MAKTYIVRGKECDGKEVYKEIDLALGQDRGLLWQINEQLYSDIEISTLKLAGNDEFKDVIYQALFKDKKKFPSFANHMIKRFEKDIYSKKVGFFLEWLNENDLAGQVLATQNCIDKLKKQPNLLNIYMASQQYESNKRYIKFIEYLQDRNKEFTARDEEKE